MVSQFAKSCQVLLLDSSDEELFGFFAFNVFLFFTTGTEGNRNSNPLISYMTTKPKTDTGSTMKLLC